MKLVVFIQVALLFVQVVRSGHVEDESPVGCESTLERCINTDCLGNKTVLEEIKQELCDIQDTECTDNPCKNGGTCINVTDTAVCQCPPVFVGNFCELNCTEVYETVPGLIFDALSLRIEGMGMPINSAEECDSACTGNCTASTFEDPLCFRFRAPVFSVTPVPAFIGQIQAEAACKATCTSQMNSCRSYFLAVASTAVCYTFSVSATDLPVASIGSSIDIVNKITKCDIFP